MRWIVVAWIVVAVAGDAHAQSSPGPLAKSHERIACVACHPITAGLVATTCAGCHDALVQRGLHATPFALGKPCTTCHRDHRGARFDLQGWNTLPGGMPRFDHAALARWPLRGRHAAIACVRCHTGTLASGRTRFAGLSTTCGAAGCHQTNPHRFAGPEYLRCDRCHTDAAWKPVKRVMDFDHDRDTKLPLDGAHRGIACITCHPRNEFALAKADCRACHPPPHGPRFDAIPGGCEACHRGARWQTVAFAHGRHTKLALTGKHADVECRACHRKAGPGNFERLQAGCKECHAHATVHADAQHPRGRFTTQQCTQCHPAGPHHTPPSPAGMFHGPRSAFPLVKGHRDVACTQCHVARSTRGRTVFDGLSAECSTCHADATHEGALGTQCAACHVAGMWDALKFEHTTYPLEGDHRALACGTCHADQRFKGAPRRCADAACHAADDVHRGQLGTTCDRCHLANGDNRFSHAISSKFKLDGKHLGVDCAGCHPSRTFKPRPFECGACHPEPRAHLGRFGTWCARCHTTKGWR